MDPKVTIYDVRPMVESDRLSTTSQQQPEVTPPVPIVSAVRVYAPLGLRLEGFIVDLWLAHMISILAIVAVASARSLPFQHWQAPVMLYVVFWHMYFGACVAVLGATPGMVLVKLRVVDAEGQPPAVARSFMRGAAYAISTVFLCGGYVAAAVDRRARRGWHDTLSGTFVVAERIGSSRRRVAAILALLAFLSLANVLIDWAT
jgi:uncharacterized RDD family membrane protein YckC